MMKLNNLNLMKGREYKLSLLYYSDGYQCNYNSDETNFTLLRISQCSSTGNFEIVYFKVNIKLRR